MHTFPNPLIKKLTSPAVTYHTSSSDQARRNQNWNTYESLHVEIVNCLPLKTTCVWATQTFQNVLCPGPAFTFYTVSPHCDNLLSDFPQSSCTFSTAGARAGQMHAHMALLHVAFSELWFSPLLDNRDLTLRVLAVDEWLIGIGVEFREREKETVWQFF